MVGKNSPGIYKITNLINNKVYIGSTIKLRDRWSWHKRDLLKNKHVCTKLQHSFNKHGLEAFKFIVLLYCEAKDLIFYEQRAIDTYKAVETGYNCRPLAHSNLGCKRSEESKLKMSLAKVGKKRGPMSEEIKQKISIGNTGKTRSEEVCKKASISRKGKKNKKPLSEETRKNMSIAKLGKSLSEKAKEKLSLVNIGKKASDETKLKLSKSITAWHKERKGVS